MLNVECGNLTCRARFNVLVGYPVTQSHRIEREREGGNDWGKPLVKYWRPNPKAST